MDWHMRYVVEKMCLLTKAIKATVGALFPIGDMDTIIIITIVVNVNSITDYQHIE